MPADIGRLVDQFALSEHAVTRQVGADIEVVGEARQPEIARRGGRKQRAGFRVELAEAQEVARQRPRQDGEVALHIARRETGGRPPELAAAGRQARRAARPVGGAADDSREMVATLIASPCRSGGPRRGCDYLITAQNHALRENRLNMPPGSRFLKAKNNNDRIRRIWRDEE